MLTNWIEEVCTLKVMSGVAVDPLKGQAVPVIVLLLAAPDKLPDRLETAGPGPGHFSAITKSFHLKRLKNICLPMSEPPTHQPLGPESLSNCWSSIRMRFIC